MPHPHTSKWNFNLYNSARYVKASGAWRRKREERRGEGEDILGTQVRRRRDVCWDPQGGEGASAMIKASRLACWSPKRISSGADPAAWECGHRSPGFCQALPQEAACSSSWPWPCCSRPSQSIFAVWEKTQKVTAIEKCLSDLSVPATVSILRWAEMVHKIHCSVHITLFGLQFLVQ